MPFLLSAQNIGVPQPTPLGATRSLTASSELSGTDELALRFLLPNNMVGSIIGKGGVMIKEITQQSNARIHINHNDDAASLERLVTVIGNPDQIVEAHRLMANRVQEEGAP